MPQNPVYHEAMLDIRLLREEGERVKKLIAHKNADPVLVDEFLKLDAEWRELTGEVEKKRGEQKKTAAARDVEGGKRLKEEVKSIEERLAAIEKEREAVWQKIPNLPSEDTPVGKDESANKVIKIVGKPPEFGFEPKDHLALGTALGVIDMESAAKVAGSRFGFMKGDLVFLENALAHYISDLLTDPKLMREIADSVELGYDAKPFTPVSPPLMIRPDAYHKMARLEPKEERYYMNADEIYLIGSAEHTLGAMHMDEIIPEERFPLRYFAFTAAFRREAGAAGKDTHGMLRVHQFNKMEMESFALPEKGLKEQEFIVAIQERILQNLDLPYQVVAIATGDMGAPDVRQIDMETWMPGQNKYRETHTADYNGDYQARRLGTKVKRADGRTEFVHMNDATAFAGRTLLTIIENYQTKEGSVKIPKILKPYIGKDFISPTY